MAKILSNTPPSVSNRKQEKIFYHRHIRTSFRLFLKKEELNVFEKLEINISKLEINIHTLIFSDTLESFLLSDLKNDFFLVF